MKKLLLTTSLLIAATVALSSPAYAQVLISWNSPQYITGDSNIATNGIYFDGINTANGGFTTTTVTDAASTVFNALSWSGAVGTDGKISVNLPSGSTYNNIGFSGGSPAYNYVVSQSSLTNDADVTIGSLSHPLTVGATYQVELWCWWNGGPYQSTITQTIGSDSSTLNFDYPGNQFAIGSFTAAASTESFTWLGPDGTSDTYGFLNDVLVRETAVPEPSTWAMMIAGLGALVFVRRLRRMV